MALHYYNIALYYNLMGPPSYMRLSRWQKRRYAAHNCTSGYKCPSAKNTATLGMFRTAQSALIARRSPSHRAAVNAVATHLQCVRSVVELQRHVYPMHNVYVSLTRAHTLPCSQQNRHWIFFSRPVQARRQWRLRDRPIADSMQLRPAANPVWYK